MPFAAATWRGRPPCWRTTCRRCCRTDPAVTRSCSSNWRRRCGDGTGGVARLAVSLFETRFAVPAGCAGVSLQRAGRGCNAMQLVRGPVVARMPAGCARAACATFTQTPHRPGNGCAPLAAQRFIERVRGGDVDGALAFAQATLAAVRPRCVDYRL